MRRWLAVGAVAAAAFGLNFAYVRSLEAEARGGQLVRVLAASQKIPRGTALSKDALATREIPEAFVGARAILAARASEVLGLEVTVDVEPQEVVQWTDIAPRDGANKPDLAAQIGPGERAMTIAVDASLSMGGLLEPGHRVDILGTFARQGALKGDKVTMTLLQNVTVLATGKKLGVREPAEEEGLSKARFATVTLSVSLEEAALLSNASRGGTLSLVLRGYRDTEIVEGVPEKGMDDIFRASERDLKSPQKSQSAGANPIERIR